MPLQPHTATITGPSERAETWRKVFGTDVVEIRTPIESRIMIEGVGERSCYIVAAERLAPVQLDRVVQHISQRFKIAPSDALRIEILERGIPILAEDVVVSFDLRYCL